MPTEDRLVTLLDGREVSSSSEEWRAECLARNHHVQKVLAMLGKANRARRDAYYEWVGRTEGAQQEARVRAAVGHVWKMEQARMKEQKK